MKACENVGGKGSWRDVIDVNIDGVRDPLFHLPRSLISSFESPLVLAVTVAPFRSECPDKPFVEMPDLRRYSWILSTKY